MPERGGWMDGSPWEERGDPTNLTRSLWSHQHIPSNPCTSMATLFLLTRRNPVQIQEKSWSFQELQTGQSHGIVRYLGVFPGWGEGSRNELPEHPSAPQQQLLGLEPGKGFIGTRAKDKFHLWIADSWSYLEEETSFLKCCCWNMSEKEFGEEKLGSLGISSKADPMNPTLGKL